MVHMVETKQPTEEMSKVKWSYTPEGKIINSTGATICSARHLRQIMLAAPFEDFKSAYVDSHMTNSEMDALFGITPSDMNVLAKVYNLHRSRAIASRVEVKQHLPIDMNEIADRLVHTAMEKLQADLNTRVKMVVANALFEASEALRHEVGVETA